MLCQLAWTSAHSDRNCWIPRLELLNSLFWRTQVDAQREKRCSLKRGCLHLDRLSGTLPRCDFLPLRPRRYALVQDSLYIPPRPIPYATSLINFIKRMLCRHQFKESTGPSQLFSYSASQQTNSGNTFSRAISDYALGAIALSTIINMLLRLLGASLG